MSHYIVGLQEFNVVRSVLFSANGRFWFPINASFFTWYEIMLRIKSLVLNILSKPDKWSYKIYLASYFFLFEPSGGKSLPYFWHTFSLYPQTIFGSFNIPSLSWIRSGCYMAVGPIIASTLFSSLSISTHSEPFRFGLESRRFPRPICSENSILDHLSSI
jgi:hypothetical protein